jgi:hypothetical protein
MTVKILNHNGERQRLPDPLFESNGVERRI